MDYTAKKFKFFVLSLTWNKLLVVSGVLLIGRVIAPPYTSGETGVVTSAGFSFPFTSSSGSLLLTLSITLVVCKQVSIIFCV
jgi:hypothetical protein